MTLTMNRISNIKKLIVFVIIVGLSLSVNAAEMYRWVDDEGVVHFSDEKSVGITETKQLRIQDSEPKTEIPAVKPEVSVKKGTTSQPEPKRSPGRVVTRTQQKLENFPLVLQKHNWCAFASTEMVLKYYGFDIDQDEIFQRLKGRGTIARGEGLDPRTVARFLSRSGFNVDYREEGDLETIKSYIDKSIPVMCSRVVPGKWEGSRHMSVIIGYDDVYKSVVIADPGYGCEISLSYDEFKDQWVKARKAMIAVSR